MLHLRWVAESLYFLMTATYWNGFQQTKILYIFKRHKYCTLLIELNWC